MRLNIACLWILLVCGSAQASLFTWGPFFALGRKPKIDEASCETLLPPDVLNTLFPERFLDGQPPSVFEEYARKLHTALELGTSPDKNSEAQKLIEADLLNRFAVSTLFRYLPVRSQISSDCYRAAPLFRYLPADGWRDPSVAGWMATVFEDLLRLARLKPEPLSSFQQLNEVYVAALDVLYDLLAYHLGRHDSFQTDTGRQMLEALDESLPRLLEWSQGSFGELYAPNYREAQIAALRLWKPIFELNTPSSQIRWQLSAQACSLLRNLAENAGTDEKIRSAAEASLKGCL